MKVNLQELLNKSQVYSTSELIEKIITNNEGNLTHKGSIYTTTGKFTGRSPNDKYIVDEVTSRDNIDWNNNQSISKEHFIQLYKKTISHLTSKDETYLFNGFVGADINHRQHIQVINEYAWHNLFAHQLFIPMSHTDSYSDTFTLLYAPTLEADPLADGTNSETFIIISFEEKVILIGGTAYAGEQKKAMFTVMNYLLPQKDVLSMHCSANIGEKEDVALFFGLSGTGKTTLSADPHRKLIGDDEHGWSEDGIFNIEGGCYAKTTNLTREKEPQIYDAISYGAILENVIVGETNRIPDYFDTSLTENTRAAYSIEAMDNIAIPSIGGHPNTIIFLTADAFGVLPPVSILTKEQVIYHFLSGYTSKLAGTERGITTPQTTFSTCFGAPFLPLSPLVYATLLSEKIEQFGTQVYLVNTGWTGGAYGIGERISLSHTRTILHEILSGHIDIKDTTIESTFGLHIPNSVTGVPKHILHPIDSWNNKDDYNKQATLLADKFKENFKKFTDIPDIIIQHGQPLV